METFKSSRGIIKLTALLLCVAIMLTGCQASETVSITEMLTDAQKYLTDMDYEQAIIEFNKILEIDPKNVDAYIGLADVYLRLGDVEKAVEILRQGLEKTRDAKLQTKIDNILNHASPRENLNGTNVPTFEPMGAVTILGEEYDIAATTHLDLSGKGITNDVLREIEPQIQALTNLTSINFSDNEISNVQLLEKLNKLIRLDLTRNKISDTSALENLTDLTDLRLGQNQIKNIS